MLSPQTIRWIEDHGFNPAVLEQTGRHQDTPLLLASRQGLTDIVQELLAAGANPNHRNMDGTNALWAAVVANSEKIAEMLLAHGADIDNQNDNGATALMYAASSGKTAWVNFLLAREANASLQSLDDFTALDLAGNVEILRLLRQHARTLGAPVPGVPTT